MSKRPLLSGVTEASAAFSIHWPFYECCTERGRRASDYIHDSWTRTGKAWSLGFLRRRRRGANGRGRTGKERKGPHIHVTGGNRKILGNVLFPHLFIRPCSRVCTWGVRSFSSPTSSPQSAVSALCRQPRRGGLTLSHSHWTSRQDSAQAKRAATAAADWKKGNDIGGLLKKRGHTSVHKASGQRNGAIVLQLRASRDRSGALLISLRGSLQRERETESSAASCSTQRLARGASDRGLVVVVIWTFIGQTDVSFTDGNLYPIAIPPSLYPPSDPGSDPPLGRCPRRGVPDHHRPDQLTPGGGSVPLTPALPRLSAALADPSRARTWQGTWRKAGGSSEWWRMPSSHTITTSTPITSPGPWTKRRWRNAGNWWTRFVS